MSIERFTTDLLFTHRFVQESKYTVCTPSTGLSRQLFVTMVLASVHLKAEHLLSLFSSASGITFTYVTNV